MVGAAGLEPATLSFPRPWQCPLSGAWRRPRFVRLGRKADLIGAGALRSAYGRKRAFNAEVHDDTASRAATGKQAMAMIEVRRLREDDPPRFAVVVGDGACTSRHEVTLSAADCVRLTGGGHTPEQIIEAAFRFLLEREPKEAILSDFDVSIIPRYFPDFERAFPGYLEDA